MKGARSKAAVHQSIDENPLKNNCIILTVSTSSKYCMSYVLSHVQQYFLAL